MTFFESLFLGIVQGIAEFFPISSSAHLKLVKFFFKTEILNDLYLFDLICHLGTLLSSIIFLRKEIVKILKDKSDIYLIIFAILPLFPFYFFFKPITKFLSKSYFLPFFLLFTSALLYITSKIKIKKMEEITYKRKITDVILIGFMQAIALIPGISRSASTITSAYLRGWDVSKAIRFSFILAIPTVLGGAFLESLKHLLKHEISYQINMSSYIIGFMAAFLVGMFSIRYILSIKTIEKLRPFAIYLFILAIFSFIYLNFVK